MSVTIHIPSPLRPLVGEQDTVIVEREGTVARPLGTVGEILHDLSDLHGELGKHLFSENGHLRNFINVYVNDEDIRYQDGEQTALKSGDTVSIVPAIAGGH